jgi:hypothetical protein
MSKEQDFDLTRHMSSGAQYSFLRVQGTAFLCNVFFSRSLVESVPLSLSRISLPLSLLQTLHQFILYSLCYSPLNRIRAVKSRMIRWSWNVAHLGDPDVDSG